MRREKDLAVERGGDDRWRKDVHPSPVFDDQPVAAVQDIDRACTNDMDMLDLSFLFSFCES